MKIFKDIDFKTKKIVKLIFSLFARYFFDLKVRFKPKIKY